MEVTNVATIADVELETFVLYLASVNPLTGALAHHTDTWHEYQNVLGLFEVPLERSIQGVTEHAEVHTEVGLCGGLPFQVVVTQLVTFETAWQSLSAVATLDVVAGTVALSAEASLAIVALVDGIASYVGNLLVTSLTPRCSQLQVVQPVDVLHELLLVDTPSSTYRWEGTVAVVLAETARTIITHGQAEQVAVSIVVVQLAEIRYQGVALTITIGFRLSNGSVRPHIVWIQYGKVVCFTAE